MGATTSTEPVDKILRGRILLLIISRGSSDDLFPRTRFTRNVVSSPFISAGSFPDTSQWFNQGAGLIITRRSDSFIVPRRRWDCEREMIALLFAWGSPCQDSCWLMIERSRKRSDWFRPSFENIGRHGNRERERDRKRGRNSRISRSLWLFVRLISSEFKQSKCADRTLVVEIVAYNFWFFFFWKCFNNS